MPEDSPASRAKSESGSNKSEQLQSYIRGDGLVGHVTSFPRALERGFETISETHFLDGRFARSGDTTVALRYCPPSYESCTPGEIKVIRKGTIVGMMTVESW